MGNEEFINGSAFFLYQTIIYAVLKPKADDFRQLAYKIIHSFKFTTLKEENDKLFELPILLTHSLNTWSLVNGQNIRCCFVKSIKQVACLN